MIRTAFRKKISFSLFRRIYFYSLALIFVIVLTIVSTTAVLNRMGEDSIIHGSARTLARLLTLHIQRSQSNPEQLESFLQDLHTATNLSFSIFDARGKRLAFSGNHAQAEIDTSDLPDPHTYRFYRRTSFSNLTLALLLNNKNTDYVVITWDSAGNRRRFLVLFTLVMLILALMPLVPARALAKPLSIISSTAARIGSGELSARTNLVRSDEIGLLARSVDRMAERLESVLRGEKELLANVSHEIRTPLARIHVLLELADEDQDRLQSAQGHLSQLREDIIELENLLDDVLTIARLDLGISEDPSSVLLRHAHKFNPWEIFEQIANRFNRLYPENHLQLDIATDIPDIFGSPVMIKRLLNNLIDNAVKYSPEKSSVRLTAEIKEKILVVKVMDHGTGIAESELERIFEPFHRTSDARSGGKGGIGIGLTLCKRIVLAHKGKIYAESSYDKGTVITALLPVEKKQAVTLKSLPE